MLRSQPSSHGEHVRQKRILLQPAAYDYTEWCSSGGARCGGAFLTTLLGRLVSSTSHIKMFWQDHEKFPEVWRGHAAHEPPLTSRVKCQRQQWISAGGRQDVIWTSAHLEPHCHCCHNRMKQEESVYLSLSLLCFYRTVSNHLECHILWYCKIINIYW